MTSSVDGVNRQGGTHLKNNLLEEHGQTDTETDTPGETFLFPKEKRIYLAAASVVMYLLLWLLYVCCRESLWNYSVETSVRLSKHGGFVLAYCWLFSEVVYKWYTLIIGVLGVFAPRKDRMLTSVVTFIVSYILRQFIRLIVAESRPQYVNLDITMRGGCNCSYGMPSGHAEGTAMVYALLFYNVIPLKAEKGFKIGMICLFTLITSSVCFSRVYYGRHSIPQVALGAWQAVTAFCCMLAFEDSSNAFFRRLLSGGKKEARILLFGNLVAFAINISSWFLVFDGQISNMDLKSLTCSECFLSQNLSFRHDLGKALLFPTIFFGMSIGYIIGGIRVEAYNPDYLQLHLSWLGVKRILLNLFMYSPILILMVMKGAMLPIILVGTLLYIFSGFLLSVTELKLRHKLQLNIPGDLTLVEFVGQDTSNRNSNAASAKQSEPVNDVSID